MKFLLLFAALAATPALAACPDGYLRVGHCKCYPAIARKSGHGFKADRTQHAVIDLDVCSSLGRKKSSDAITVTPNCAGGGCIHDPSKPQSVPNCAGAGCAIVPGGPAPLPNCAGGGCPK